MAIQSKANKFKRAGFIALIAGILSACGISHGDNTQNAATPAPQQTNVDDDLQIDVSTMTVAQMQDFITESNKVLKKLQAKIDSPETNPEQRFEARQAHKYISTECARMKKEVAARQATFQLDASRGSK